jgi:CRISPR system Cascade subunit CasD
MRYLLWTYYAPLSAHSVVASGEAITTSSRPTRTGVFGVLASSLGVERTRTTEIEALHDSIGFAVRIEDPGARMTDYHTAMVPRGAQVRGQSSRWHELQAGRPEAQVTYRDYVVGGLYTIAHWERPAAKVSLDQIKAALLQPVFAPFAGRASCSFGLPFDPQVVDADLVLHAFALRQLRPEVLALRHQPLASAFVIAGDEDSGLTKGRVDQNADGYAGLRAWKNRKQIVTEVTNG